MTTKSELIFLLLFLLTGTFSNAVSLRICNNCEFTTIVGAIHEASPHDTLLISGGPYAEGNIIVDKSLVLLGKNFPIIDGENKSEIFTVTSDSVSILNLHIRNVGVSYTKDRAAIKVDRCSNVLIQNNRIENGFFGIYLVHSQNCRIISNSLVAEARDEASSGNAIHLWQCRNVVVSGNQCTGHRDGIYIEFSDQCRISKNRSQGNRRYGLHFMFSDSNTYVSNIFERNKGGVAVMYSSHITMVGNSFIDNWGSATYGLLLKDIKDSEIQKNVFRNNTIGIYSEGSVRLRIEKNLVEKNGWAVVIRGSCENNVFTRNNFVSNTFDISTDTDRQSGNEFLSNYWSDYNGYDLNKDGVGDVAHSPISLFSYIIEKNPTAIILLRSLFIDLLNLAERITPSITPVTLNDRTPLMSMIQ